MEGVYGPKYWTQTKEQISICVSILIQCKCAKLTEKTVIIFTSDHGLFMGQFGLGGKALCYEQVTHVPMIIYHPQLSPKERPASSHALVQTIDIAPTLLSLAGIPIPASMQGKDLSQILQGKKKAVREFLFTENLWSTKFGNPRCDLFPPAKLHE